MNQSHRAHSSVLKHASWLFALIAPVLVFGSIAACEDATIPTTSFEAGAIELPDSGPPTITEAADTGVPDVAPDAEVDAGVDASAPAACDDGKVDPGEICDPLASCPTACPAIQCQLRTLQNPGTCNAQCVNGATQVACINGDGCCPAGGACNATNDDDCKAACGNGVVEGTESCDPLTSCPQSCAPIGCQLRTLQGAGTCDAKCVNGAKETACKNGDGCCPVGAGCTSLNDSDCAPGCGNNVVEAGETCDPLTDCPTVCPPPVGNKCQLRKLVNANTCQAACVDDVLQTQCINNDGCCPSNCNANNDNDCKPVCNNSVVEPGETCDPTGAGGTCPQSCPQQACQLYKLDNPNTCQAVCTPSGNQTKCIDKDGCCPTGCNANNDSDCKPACNNGVVEKGETCDPIASCPKCGTPAYTCFANVGKAATCDLECNKPVLKCGTANDNCCPFDSAGGCGSTTDSECAGGSWKWIQWPTVIDTTKGQCVSVVVHNIIAGGSYDFTTCAPPGGGGTGSGDPTLVDIMDDKKNSYAVTNDNCSDPNALPNLAGSTCTNKAGNLTMFCGSPSPGGFRALPGATSITLKICPAPSAGGGTLGTTPLYIWYNAPNVPNAG